MALLHACSSQVKGNRVSYHRVLPSSNFWNFDSYIDDGLVKLIIWISSCPLLIRAHYWFTPIIDSCPLLIRAYYWFVPIIDSCPLLIRAHYWFMPIIDSCPLLIPQNWWCKWCKYVLQARAKMCSCIILVKSFYGNILGFRETCSPKEMFPAKLSIWYRK